MDRFTRFDKWIRQAATLYQLPEELVRAVIKVESDYDPRAVSSAGAIGLMQLMPETAARMQVRDPYDPRENIFGGVRYLRILTNLFNGDLDLTIAAYNAARAQERAGASQYPRPWTRGACAPTTPPTARPQTWYRFADPRALPPRPLKLQSRGRPSVEHQA
jgi:soluble lytic murein transglycosylase-like protein